MGDGLLISVTAEGGVVVHVAGELDMGTASELRRVLDPLLAARASSGEEVRVDLSRVEFCDSSGLAVFIDATTHARAAGVSLQFDAPNTRLRRILAISGVDQYLDLCGSVRSSDDDVASTA